MAEPVQCVSGTGSAELSDFLFADGGDSSDFALYDDSVVPVSSSFRSPTMQTGETGLRASTVSSTTAALLDSDSSTSPSGDAQNDIDSLLHSLPSDLMDEQRDRAEAFIRLRANVFSRSEYNIGHTSIILHRTNMGDQS